MDKLLEYVCDELNELEDKVAKEHKLSSAETQYLDMLAHAKKNLLKAEEMSDEYSNGYYGEDRSMYNRNGNSYRSSYARRRDSMGRYSRRYSMDNGEMVEELRGLMESAPDERTKAEFRRFISKVESM